VREVGNQAEISRIEKKDKRRGWGRVLEGDKPLQQLRHLQPLLKVRVKNVE